MNEAQAFLMRRYRIQAFVSTWCCYAGFYFCRKAFYITKGTLTEELQLDAATLAYVGTAYLIAYAIGEFNAAAVGSRVGARRLLLGGMAISLGCNVVFGFANNVWTFMAFMALNGMGSCGAVCQEFVIGYLYDKNDPTTLDPIFAALIASASIATAMIFLLALRARAGKCNL
jgi:sugar phosphate permease